MSELLRISNLWGGYKEGVDILRGICMTVMEGETVGIIGLNGSGKSTLGKAIMNMLPIRRGEFLLNGEDVSALSTCELAHRGLAIMQQGGHVFPNLSVWENLELAFRDDFSIHDSYDSLQEAVPLLRKSKSELKHQMADKLSGGQRHQLALLMALAARPKLMILDEPSAGLSPIAVEEMYSMLVKIRNSYRLSFILVEQNVTKAMTFCNRCLVMNVGVIEGEAGEDLYAAERLLFKK